MDECSGISIVGIVMFSNRNRFEGLGGETVIIPEVPDPRVMRCLLGWRGKKICTRGMGPGEVLCMQFRMVSQISSLIGRAEVPFLSPPS